MHREAEAQRRQRQWHQDSSSSSSQRSHKRKDRQQEERQRRSHARSPGAEATPKQTKNGRARGACRNPFEGLTDSAVMRQFGGGGGLFGGVTCSRKSARKKFHELSLLHHPDKAGSNKVMNQSMHMWARAHTHTHTHTHTRCSCSALSRMQICCHAHVLICIHISIFVCSYILCTVYRFVCLNTCVRSVCVCVCVCVCVT